MESKIIGVWIDGAATWHVIGVGGGDYVTLCGLDGDDPEVGQTGTIKARRGQKIDCPQCRQIWEGVMALRLRRGNFAD